MLAQAASCPFRVRGARILVLGHHIPVDSKAEEAVIVAEIADHCAGVAEFATVQGVVDR